MTKITMSVQYFRNYIMDNLKIPILEPPFGLKITMYYLHTIDINNLILKFDLQTYSNL